MAGKPDRHVLVPVTLSGGAGASIATLLAELRACSGSSPEYLSGDKFTVKNIGFGTDFFAGNVHRARSNQINDADSS